MNARQHINQHRGRIRRMKLGEYWRDSDNNPAIIVPMDIMRSSAGYTRMDMEYRKDSSRKRLHTRANHLRMALSAEKRSS